MSRQRLRSASSGDLASCAATAKRMKGVVRFKPGALRLFETVGGGPESTITSKEVLVEHPTISTPHDPSNDEDGFRENCKQVAERALKAIFVDGEVQDLTGQYQMISTQLALGRILDTHAAFCDAARHIVSEVARPLFTEDKSSNCNWIVRAASVWERCSRGINVMHSLVSHVDTYAENEFELQRKEQSDLLDASRASFRTVRETTLHNFRADLERQGAFQLLEDKITASIVEHRKLLNDAAKNGKPLDPERKAEGQGCMILAGLFVAIDRYTPLELRILEDATAFFSSWAEERLSKGEPSIHGLVRFTDAVEKLLENETTMSFICLRQATVFLSRLIALNEVIIKNVALILDWPGDAFSAMVNDSDLYRGTTGKLFSLFHSSSYTIPCDQKASTVVQDKKIMEAFATKLGDVMTQQLTDTIDDMIGNRNMEKDIVPCMLKWKSTVGDILENALGNDEMCVQKYKNVMETVLNQTAPRGNKIAQLLAQQIDVVLRAGSQGIRLLSNKAGIALPPHQARGAKATQDSRLVRKIIDEILQIFRFLNSKDVVEAYHRKYLGKRLTVNRSSDDILERYVVKKLNDECGPAYVSRLSRMLKDARISERVFMKFTKDAATELKHIPIHFEAQVLSAGLWTLPAAVSGMDDDAAINYLLKTNGQCTELLEAIDFPDRVPSACIQLQNLYERHYACKHKGRKLRWVPTLGYAQLEFRVPSSDSTTYDLVVSIVQALILLEFNNSSHLSINKISKKLGLATSTVSRSMLAFFVEKNRHLLQKVASSEALAKDDVLYEVNPCFEAPKRLIRIYQISLIKDAASPESAEGSSHLEEDRSYAIEAAIARIMKTHQKLQHADLVAKLHDTIAHLFNTSIDTVKAAIESLIEKDFMKRDPEDASTYIYLP